MKATHLLGAIAGIASTTQAQYISLMSVRSASPVHFLPVNAANFGLHLGGISTHYCPQSMQSAGACPNTVRTNFLGGEGSLSMGAIVPGGQQVYIDPASGALKYTQAHSGIIPAGAITTGFTLTQGPSFGSLSWGDGFVACNDTDDGTWSIYAVLPNVTHTNTEAEADAGATSCLGFDAIASNQTSAAAWQYT
ncbi:hypothetical protein LTR53_005617 [Teratosphaeriaceae sp. CCFEE 6253]|nr:hypothetical protein LTR53_005617 [Teratosphaeriaceae sp. CCFEE 6253]